MTPEQTLDWLAQQHFDQCREDRPVQHWIRKMKFELPEQDPVGFAVMERPWAGLTATEIHDTDGYTETREMYRFACALEAKLKEKNT